MDEITTAEERPDDHFGLCPVCHKTDGYLNVGLSHWFVCDEHKKRWHIGWNLFSSAKDETEAEQRAAWAPVEDFEDITGHPYFYPETEEAAARAHAEMADRPMMPPDENFPF